MPQQQTKCGQPLDTSKRRQGFALLVTIVLVAFLVLILVGLAALTRVETQVATNTQKLDAARNHALMALNIAIGQLQQHAGPDHRLTAQGNLLGANVGNPWFTGVWTADASGSPVQRTWLVSGNETAPLRFGPSSTLEREGPVTDIAIILGSDGLATNGPETTSPNRVQLVGPQTAQTTGNDMANGSVVVPGVPINVTPPGQTTDRTVGRYAWWVGDQGVKASLALPDRADEVTYAPWYDPTPTTGYDQRGRIRQQIATAPTYFRRVSGQGEYGFDPLDATNENLLPRILEPDHFDLLKPAVATAPLSDFRREQFHRLTDRAYAVLANTLTAADAHRGLQRDLSQAPGELGSAFVAQSNLAAYMETPSATNGAVPPITSHDSPRRRYRITAPVSSASTPDDPAIDFKVSPVLSSFMLQFRVVRSGGDVQVRARMVVELWNPYTSALVPETLSLHVTGLPQIRITDAAGSGSLVDINLQNPPAFLTRPTSGNPLVVNLPFIANGNNDRTSWLPGRFYAWRTATASPTESADLQFYNKTVSSSWTYANNTLGATDDRLRVDVNADTTLEIELKNSAGDTLATYTSPEFPRFSIDDVENPSTDNNWKFGFGFRLRQPSTLNKDRDWLLGPSGNFAGHAPGANIFVPFNELLGIDPDAYVGTVQTASDIQNFLLFRVMGTTTGTSRSATMDVPVFEMPRLPYLSVGELQQLMLPDLPAFAAGNSWGGKANAWFDRYFFSGLTTAVIPPQVDHGEPLPNWNLQVLDTGATTAGALSSEHLLQAGGFNINSCLPESWRAVLSGVRFSQNRAFDRADIDNSSSATPYTGSQPAAATTTAEYLSDDTLDDDADPIINPVGGPAFFRFPQSAQETYYWVNNSSLPSDFDSTQAFRQGVRGGDQPVDGSTLQTLTTAQIELLADSIVTRLRQHASASGPYRSLQQFLSPDPVWSGRNLLEQAIDDAGINPAAIAPINPVANTGDIGFSSLTLTSADIMTALAPYLRTRSDTFVVRTYGESLNPVTGEVEGRAWCEATVQRFPEPLDPAETNVAAPSSTGFGRAFHITRFRWLSPSDI